MIVVYGLAFLHLFLWIFFDGGLFRSIIYPIAGLFKRKPKELINGVDVSRMVDAEYQAFIDREGLGGEQ